MGFVTMGAAGLGAIVFSMIGPLSKRFDERLLLFVLGIIPMLIGRMIMFPIPSLAPHPPVNCFSNASWIPNFPDCETCHIDLPSTTPESSTFSSMSSPGSHEVCGQIYNVCFWDWPSCQLNVKLSSSSLYIYLSDTKITFHPHHNTIKNFLSTIEVTYTQVWYIIRIVSSSLTHFHSERIRLIRVPHDLTCQYCC